MTDDSWPEYMRVNSILVSSCCHCVLACLIVAVMCRNGPMGRSGCFSDSAISHTASCMIEGECVFGL